MTTSHPGPSSGFLGPVRHRVASNDGPSAGGWFEPCRSGGCGPFAVTPRLRLCQSFSFRRASAVASPVIPKGFGAGQATRNPPREPRRPACNTRTIGRRAAPVAMSQREPAELEGCGRATGRGHALGCVLIGWRRPWRQQLLDGAVDPAKVARRRFPRAFRGHDYGRVESRSKERVGSIDGATRCP